MKASTGKAGADVKESGFFADAGHLQDAGLKSQSPSLCLSGDRGFYKEAEGKQNKEIKGGDLKCLYVQMSTVQCTSS